MFSKFYWSKKPGSFLFLQSSTCSLFSKTTNNSLLICFFINMIITDSFIVTLCLSKHKMLSLNDNITKKNYSKYSFISFTDIQDEATKKLSKVHASIQYGVHELIEFAQKYEHD